MWRIVVASRDAISLGAGVTLLPPEQTMSVAAAVQGHRETHHPTQYNVPESPLILKVELSLATDKKVQLFVSPINLLTLTVA